VNYSYLIKYLMRNFLFHQSLGKSNQISMSMSFITLFAVLVFSAGCRDMGTTWKKWFLIQDQKESVELTAEANGKHLIAGMSFDIIDKAGLHVEWMIPKIPMSSADKLTCIFYHNGRLYAQDNHNFLYQFDTYGTLVWSQRLGKATDYCSSPFFEKGQMLFVAGNAVVTVRESDGRTTKRMEIKYPIVTSVAGGPNRYYLGSSNRRFYSINNKTGLAEWRRVNRELPTGTVAVGHSQVYYVCLDGVLYVTRNNDKELLWKKVTAGESPGVVVDEDQCFLPSGDTALYCLDGISGKTIWKFLSGGSLKDLPVLTKDFVYQSVGHASLACLDRRTDRRDGSLRWQLKRGDSMLAENGPLCYTITHDRKMTVMDNRTGKAVKSIYVPQMDLFASNTEDATIFMANSEGAVLVLKPNRIFGSAPKQPAQEIQPKAEAIEVETPQEGEEKTEVDEEMSQEGSQEETEGTEEEPEL